MRAIEIIGRLREKYSNKYTKTPNHNKDHYIQWLQDEYAELVMKQANGAEQSTSNCNIPHVSNSLPFIDLEVCERLALETDYACEAVGEEINTGDAGAFFLEGYEYAKKLLGNDC